MEVNRNLNKILIEDKEVQKGCNMFLCLPLVMFVIMLGLTVFILIKVYQMDDENNKKTGKKLYYDNKVQDIGILSGFFVVIAIPLVFLCRKCYTNMSWLLLVFSMIIWTGLLVRTLDICKFSKLYCSLYDDSDMKVIREAIPSK